MRRNRLLLLACLGLLGKAARAAPEGGGPRASPVAPAAEAPSEPRSPALTAEAAMSRATAFYEAGQYVECASAFASLLDDAALAGELAVRSREQARIYRAACLIAQGQATAADDQFRVAIRESPQMAAPNAIVFPPPVIERFIVVRSEMLEEIRRSEEERTERQREAAVQAQKRAQAERKRIVMLEHLAAEETVITKNRRWIASVPLGIGQFQNRDYTLGTVFLVGETLLLGTAITAVSIELSLNSQANGGAGLTTQGQQVQQLNQNIRVAHRVGLYSVGGLILAIGGGILEANLSFVPEFSDGTRPRARKPPHGLSEPSVAPSVSASSEGAELSLVGRF